MTEPWARKNLTRVCASELRSIVITSSNITSKGLPLVCVGGISSEVLCVSVGERYNHRAECVQQCFTSHTFGANITMYILWSMTSKNPTCGDMHA